MSCTIFFNTKYNNTAMKNEDKTYPTSVGKVAINTLGNTVYDAESRKQCLQHPTMKKVFMQIGKKFKLPDDIVDGLYSILRQNLRMEEESTQRFSRNILLLNVMVSEPFRMNRDNLYDCKGSQYEEGNPLDYRLPESRNCEWAIKNSGNKKLKFNENNEPWKFLDIREKLFIEIKILGEKNYLFDLNSAGYGIRRFNVAEKKKKILYLNNSSFEEMYFDYQNFLEWKGGPNESSWSLALDNTGDSMFFLGH